VDGASPPPLLWQAAAVKNIEATARTSNLRIISSFFASAQA
jgi:hypothetical protein